MLSDNLRQILILPDLRREAEGEAERMRYHRRDAILCVGLLSAYHPCKVRQRSIAARRHGNRRDPKRRRREDCMQLQRKLLHAAATKTVACSCNELCCMQLQRKLFTAVDSQRCRPDAAHPSILEPDVNVPCPFGMIAIPNRTWMV